MSNAQAIASDRFLKAMGSMVDDEEKLSKVLDFIDAMKQRASLPKISAAELENYIPLDQAFDSLRAKAKEFYTTKSA